MERKRRFLRRTSVLASCLLALGLTGCFLLPDGQMSIAVGISSIEKTSSEGLVDTYTIYYTDGSTSTFEVTNGADGQDGIDGVDGKNGSDVQGVTALELYETYKEIYGDDLEYAEFLSLYMSCGGEESNTEKHTLINECLQSVGKMYCGFTEWNTETTDDTEDTTKAIYTGACVIYRIDADYTYFITNYHLVYGEDAIDGKISKEIYCYLYGSEDFPAKKTDENGTTYLDGGKYGIACEYIGGAAQYDLAIVRAQTSDVTKINENVKAITFADDYYVGQTAVAVGNPNGAGLSVTEGIVSVDNEYVTLSVDGTSRSHRSIRIDTALYHGNSGGGVFNAAGELIGIANAGNIGDQNINYAIPVQMVKAVTENIMLHYSDGDDSTVGVYKITLGVTVTSQNSKYTYNAENGYGKITEEILVKEVTSGSIASEIGIRADDVLTTLVINGVDYELERYFEIADYILSLTDGVAFSFKYDRNGTIAETAVYTVTSSNLALVA